MSENLIFLLIKEDFGETAAHVSNILLQNGELSMGELVQQSNLPFNEVKQNVIVLIKHNIIVFFNKSNPLGTQPSEPSVNLIEDFVYRISVQDVLYRLRFAKVLFHIGKIYGNPAQAIMEDFIANGRLTVSDCVAEMEEHKKDETIENFSEGEVLEALAGLIKGQYIIQCDKSSYLSGQYDLNTGISQSKPGINMGKTSRRKAPAIPKDPGSKGKRTKKTKGNPADEINMLAQNGLTKDIFARLGMIPGKESLVLNEKKEVEIGKGKVIEMKEEYSKTHPLFFDLTSKDEYMLKINFRKLVHDFRTEFIMEVVSNRLNPQSSLVVQAMLRDSQLFSKANIFRISEPLTMSEIIERLPQGITWTEDIVDKHLQLLQLDKFVQKVKNSDPKIYLPSYAVDMEYLVKKIQIKTLEKIIEDKYSKNHSRIFRILDNLGYLDEKQISDTGLLPLKQVRTCVVELIVARIVDSQDVTLEGKATQIYGLRPHQAVTNILGEIYKTLFNLKKREEVEINKKIMLIEMHASEDDIENTDTLIKKLESAAIELDDTLMLFNEF